MERIVAADANAGRDRVGRSGAGHRPLIIAATVVAALMVTGLGGARVVARGTDPRPNASAASVAVQSSHARVRVTAYDGGGPTTISKIREASDVDVFDKTVIADDTDDADRGAKGTADQFSSIVVDGPSIIVHALGTGTARLNDTKPSDGFKPVANGESTLTVTIDVADGAAVWSLRGTLEGDSDTANLDCGSAILTAPDGIVTRANADCELDDSVTVDQGGSLGPGSHTLEMTAGASVRTNSGRSVRAGGKYELVLVLSACSVTGTPEADALVGTTGDDVICGLGGPDDIQGLAGDDTIFGGDGPDDISGGPGDDLIFGGEGVDIIRGGIDNDSIFGGADNDQISDLRGPNSLLSGDAGTDVICGSNQRDHIDGGGSIDVVLGLGGRDDIRGGGGGDTLVGDGSADFATAIGCDQPAGSSTGGRGDVIDGGPGDDRIDGGPGEDVLRGGNDKDEVDGGSAGDTIAGGRGKDVLRGESGNDTMNACDGVRDNVFGGAGGNDVVKRDVGIDHVHADVETRRRC